MKDVTYIDTSGLIAPEEIIEARRTAGNRTMLSTVQPSVLAALERFGVLELLGKENVFEHILDAIASVPQPEAPAGAQAAETSPAPAS